MKINALQTFLGADFDEQAALLDSPALRNAVAEWMGPAAWQQYLSHAPTSQHLSAGPKNIIFAPGIMGSTLQSNGLGGVWWLDVRAREKLNELRLTPDGLADIDPHADIVPGAVDLSYVPFRKALASSRDFGGSVQFPYDWRKSLRVSAAGLRDLILKVHKDYDKPVHLVGHSMGGLMIRIALMLHGKEVWPKIGKIVFIGTPHFGSASIAGYLKNHFWGKESLAILGMFLNRETFRSMRGALSLLPAPAGVYPGTQSGGEHPCANFDLYDANAWKLELDAPGTVRLQDVLNEVRQFHTDLLAWHNSLLQQDKDRMLMIAGVGQETLFRLEFDRAFWGLWKHTKKITSRIECDANRDGDGRVPLASAHLDGVATRYIKGKHGGLTNIPAVAKEVMAFLTDGKLNLADTCKGALAQHLSAGDDTSSAPLLDGTDDSDYFRELPEWEIPTLELRKKIESQIDSGQFPGLNLTKIL